MRLTIEIGNPTEVQQFLRIFRNLNLESAHIVVDEKESSTKDLLNTINQPIKKRLDLNALKKEKNYSGVNRKRFDRLVEEINIVEPIDTLLSQLSK